MERDARSARWFECSEFAREMQQSEKLPSSNLRRRAAFVFCLGSRARRQKRILPSARPARTAFKVLLLGRPARAARGAWDFMGILVLSRGGFIWGMKLSAARDFSFGQWSFLFIFCCCCCIGGYKTARGNLQVLLDIARVRVWKKILRWTCRVG